jgi:4a-hydroxytetrahydrobiopterin dehydratase
MVINTVGHLSEAAWHHPDITASYAWVEVRLMKRPSPTIKLILGSVRAK